MPKTVALYTLEELAELYPMGYASVRKRWIDLCERSEQIPWSDEILDSLKALVKAMGFALRDWQIGPWCRSHIDLREPHDIDLHDARQYALDRLRAAGYVDDGSMVPTTDGRCKLTGVCYDDDYVEAFWQEIEDGASVNEALLCLAHVASKRMEEECEAHKDHETMEASWGHRLFTRSGAHVPAID